MSDQPNPPKRENEAEWNRFFKLGEMMGDGLHNEPDGKWISKEYRQLSRILIPEIKKTDSSRRKQKAIAIDAQMKTLLENNKCSCGGCLVQKRSGTKVAYCEVCDSRYVARNKKT